MNTLPEFGRLDIPSAPRPHQPMLYGSPPLFGRHGPMALEKLLLRRFRHPLRLDGQAIVERLNQMEMPYWGISALRDAGTADQFFRYAKAIAQHTAALGELLYGKPLDGSGQPPAFVSIAAREALYHMGRPPAVSLEDMLPETDRAAEGVALLHHAALHAAAKWAKLKANEKINTGKPHVRGLVQALARLYAEAFGIPPKRHPSATSPEVIFCSLMARFLFNRLARFHSAPLPIELLELKALDAQKVVDHLRPQRRRAKAGAGVGTVP